MKHLILHPHTKEHVAQFIARPSHAVLLAGSNGSGKTTLGQAIVAKILELEPGKLSAHPYYMTLRSEKDSISIDTIRELQRFLQLKTIGQRPLRRAVVVEHAEDLTLEAQNAFLKLLEEPPADTVMILTADSPRSLLPTILSRVQLIPLHAPSEQDLKAHFTAQGKEMSSVEQAYFLSGGLPGLMSALLDDSNEQHPLLQGVITAKKILQLTTFERLALSEGLSRQKEETKYTLEALQHIAHTGVGQAGKKGDPAKLKQWHHILKITTEARDALAHNANTKLVLDKLMLCL